MPASLDPTLVHRVVNSFPAAGEWNQVCCSALRVALAPNSDARNWSPLTRTGCKGGVYAFLFPQKFFAAGRIITLDGPGQRAIPFQFSVLPNQLADQDGFVAYVGRAANLLQRFQWHFSLAQINTGAQVQCGLVKCGVCQNRKEAVTFMLDQAKVAFHILDGDDHAANRDVVELSLCSRYMSPFNIKSER